MQGEAQFPSPTKQGPPAARPLQLLPPQLLDPRHPALARGPAVPEGVQHGVRDEAEVHLPIAVHVAVQGVVEGYVEVALLTPAQLAGVDPQVPSVVAPGRLVLAPLQPQEEALEPREPLRPEVRLQREVLQDRVPEERPHCEDDEPHVEGQGHQHQQGIHDPMLHHVVEEVPGELVAYVEDQPRGHRDGQCPQVRSLQPVQAEVAAVVERLVADVQEDESPRDEEHQHHSQIHRREGEEQQDHHLAEHVNGLEVVVPQLEAVVEEPKPLAHVVLEQLLPLPPQHPEEGHGRAEAEEDEADGAPREPLHVLLRLAGHVEVVLLPQHVEVHALEAHDQ
mmetsp:Transcript_3808/g.10568  ORF Transcript_3808/g.10568 Transcript_3808/m.10568 type:complete len:336 (-) Transcript_3808:159-1166(-)